MLFGSGSVRRRAPSGEKSSMPLRASQASHSPAGDHAERHQARDGSRDDVRRHVGPHAHDGGLPGSFALHQPGDGVAVRRPDGRDDVFAGEADGGAADSGLYPDGGRSIGGIADEGEAAAVGREDGVRQRRGGAGRKIARGDHGPIDARLHVVDPDLGRAGAVGGVEQLIAVWRPRRRVHVAAVGEQGCGARTHRAGARSGRNRR